MYVCIQTHACVCVPVCVSSPMDKNIRIYGLNLSNDNLTNR